MMKFDQKEIYSQIHTILKEVFDLNGISLLRADDKEYHQDLYYNVKTYMHGCGIGVAIFDRIKTNEFNPNVSLEIGYMDSLSKPILLLKDESLEVLPTDLMGRLYREFDPFSLKNTLTQSVNNWLNDQGLCFTCFECKVVLDRRITELSVDSNLIDQCIQDIAVHAPKKTPLVKGLEESLDNGFATIVFEADIDFYQHIRKLYNSSKLFIENNIKVTDVLTSNKEINWGDHGVLTIEKSHLGGKGQICRLEYIEGCEEIINRGKVYLPGEPVYNLNECSIALVIDAEGMVMAVSNLINSGCVFPTKLAIGTWLFDNGDSLPLFSVTANIAAGPGLSIFPSDQELAAAHMFNVKYYIQKSIVDNRNFRIDFDGARNISLV